MLMFAAIFAYIIVGTIIGRILFVKRLGYSDRYMFTEKDEWGFVTGRQELIETTVNSSAQTYGLWSIVVWPLTLAVFLIQLPTPIEKKAHKAKEMEELRKQLSTVAEELTRDINLVK